MASRALTRINWKLALVAALLGLFAALAMPPLADAAGFLPLPDSTNLDVPKAEGDTAIERTQNILGPTARVIRIIIGSVATLMIIVAGVSMLISADNEENVKNQKQALTYGVIGLILVSLAGPLAEVFDFRQGNLLADSESLLKRGILFDRTTQLVITFMKFMLGGLASLFMVRAGALMVIGGAAEETVSREKKNLALGAGGLLMVIVSDLLVRRILFNLSYTEETGTIVAIDQNELVRQLVGFTNLLIRFVGPILMLLMVVGGLMYVVSGGNEERQEMGKKILMNSVIGVVIIYGAYALVTTVIAGVF